MRHYETLFIINPEISDEDADAVVDKFTGILTEREAFIGMVDKWGRRRLAYTVKSFNKGYYVLLDYGATPQAVAEMERLFKIDEQVIRFLTVKQADDYDLEAAKAALEAREAKQVQAEAEKASKAEADEAEASAEPEAEAQEPAAEETASDEAKAEEPDTKPQETQE